MIDATPNTSKNATKIINANNSEAFLRSDLVNKPKILIIKFTKTQKS